MNYNLKTFISVMFVFFEILSYGQSKGKFLLKNKFTIPHNEKYSLLIVTPKDTLYSYDSIFWIAFEKDATGIYIEMDKNFISFEGYLFEGKLNGLYRRYSHTNGLLWMYGKYINDTCIEQNKIIYDDKNNVTKVEVDKVPKPLIRNK